MSTTEVLSWAGIITGNLAILINLWLMWRGRDRR